MKESFDRLYYRSYEKKWWKVGILIVIILLLLVECNHMTDSIRPTLIALCKVKSQGLATSIAGKVVQKVMGGLGYLDLITLDRDDAGNILALRANVIELNQLTSNINTMIQEEYFHLDDLYIKIPLGNFMGNELLAGRGPRITVRMIPAGTVSTDYKTEFLSSGINQTRHRIYIEIKSQMTVVAPFISDTVEVVTNVNVAETVLIGNVPDTFYHLEGVGNEPMNSPSELIQ